jgi:hypothetical protein
MSLNLLFIWVCFNSEHSFYEEINGAVNELPVFNTVIGKNLNSLSSHLKENKFWNTEFDVHEHLVYFEIQN